MPRNAYQKYRLMNQIHWFFNGRYFFFYQLLQLLYINTIDLVYLVRPSAHPQLNVWNDYLKKYYFLFFFLYFGFFGLDESRKSISIFLFFSKSRSFYKKYFPLKFLNISFLVKKTSTLKNWFQKFPKRYFSKTSVWVFCNTVNLQLILHY